MVVPWLGLGTFTAGAHGMAKKKKNKSAKKTKVFITLRFRVR